MMKKIKTAVFISGEGSNFKSIYRNSKKKDFPFKIEIVISDRKCKGHEFSKSVIDKTYILENHNKNDFEKEAHKILKNNEIELICLAGFMKILSKEFVKKWANKILNIHPSILPLFPGLNTHKKVIKQGMKIHGSTVHIVDKGIDTGTIIAQSAITINNLDDEKVIEEKIKKTEHYLYSRAIRNYVLHFYFKKNKNSLKSLKNKYSRVLYSI